MTLLANTRKRFITEPEFIIHFKPEMTFELPISKQFNAR